MKTLILAFVCSVPLFLHMLGMPLAVEVQALLATIVQFGAGYSFYIGTWYGLRSFSANMDTLVALGTSAAYGFSLWNGFIGATHLLYFETSALLIAFILLGRYLEGRAKRQASQGMNALLRLQPKKARVKAGDTFEDIPVEEVALQAVFRVRPGERIPVDGVVITGESYVDEAMLTGESTLTWKRAGDPIYAGTLNKEGLLEARATRVGRETALGNIIQMVEKAQSSKAPIQRLADKVTAVLVPCVLVISFLTFIYWMLVSTAAEGLINAVAVLVITCPCALGLATPAVIMVACGRAARMGILVKDASVLEIAQKIKTVLLDKTGTVTEGQLTVTKEIFNPQGSQADFYPITAALSQHSDHPASRALLSHMQTRHITPSAIESYRAHPGQGVSGKLAGKTYYLGSPDFLKRTGIDTEDFSTRWAQEKGMIVAVASDNKVLGYYALADRLRLEAKEAIAHLHRLKCDVHLVTGDRYPIAEKIAQELEVDGFTAEVLPGHKAEIVARFKEKGKCVAMVGDGINDAPALAAADVGFGIGSGTDIALESASVILIHPDLNGVAATILLAQETFRKIRQNLVFAFGYNILGIPLAACGLLNPIIAGVAMALSSISVVTNALLLQRKKFQAFNNGTPAELTK